MTQGLENMPELALDWHRSGKGAVLATVVETWGSAPRPVGSQLVISGEGELQGSVSGGCVEGAVLMAALDARESGKAELLEFGVSDDEAFAVGLACGGRIRVLVEPVGGSLAPETLEALVAARAERRSVAYEVGLDGSGGRIRSGADPALAERFRADRSGVDGARFIAIHNPALRLFVVGAVHIAQALVPMARMMGYDCTVIDPRPAFAAETRFPGETIRDAWPDEVLAEMELDARSAVITLSHDPKIDDPAIHAALRSEVFYLGCLGSSRTHAKRVARLTEAGFTMDEIARIHGPVGLRIGAQGPAEIAVAILAELTARLRLP